MVAPNAPGVAEDEREALRRALRDLEAAEQRVLRNAERVYDETRSKLVLELLPVLDNLDRTIEAATREASPALLDGARMVRTQLLQVLLRYGAEPIVAHDTLFDPAIHDATATLPVHEPRLHNRVVQQLQPGYRFGDRVLRPARVVVGVMQRR